MSRCQQSPRFRVVADPDAGHADDDDRSGDPSVAGSGDSLIACECSSSHASTCGAPQRIESLVDVIQTELRTKRLALFRIDGAGSPCLVLRQQEWASGIGWFTQRSVEIEPEQLGPLQCALRVCDGGSSSSGTRGLRCPTPADRRGLRIVS